MFVLRDDRNPRESKKSKKYSQYFIIIKPLNTPSKQIFIGIIKKYMQTKMEMMNSQAITERHSQSNTLGNERIVERKVKEMFLAELSWLLSLFERIFMDVSGVY
jgi:hypothetical protein